MMGDSFRVRAEGRVSAGGERILSSLELTSISLLEIYSKCFSACISSRKL